MRNLLIILTLINISAFTQTVATTEFPDKAHCPVCALNGEDKAEKVRAASEHDGQMYYFCNEDCKTTFDADPVAYLPPVLPRPASDFSLQTRDGESVSLVNFREKWVLIDFWATWCAPCIKTMPKLNKLYQQNADKGLVVLGIAIDEEDDRLNKINKIIAKKNIAYPILLDALENPVWNQFKVKSIPAMFLIDPNGQIVQQWAGNFDDDEVVKSVQIFLSH